MKTKEQYLQEQAALYDKAITLLNDEKFQELMELSKHNKAEDMSKEYIEKTVQYFNETFSFGESMAPYYIALELARNE